MRSWQAQFVLKKAEWLLTEALLSDVFPALTVKPVVEGDPHSDEDVRLIFPEEPDRDVLDKQLKYIFATYNLDAPDVMIEALPDIDWLQHVYAQLTPIEAGRFFVHGSHITKDIPDDKIAIIIEAATAFGTGEHPTTKGCLLMFDKMLAAKHQPTNILDMGCGSAILAVAAAKTLDAKILGVDIDVPSIRVAQNHARDNHVADQIDLIAGDGFRLPELQQRAPYDLIFANILAQPLIEMSTDLCKVLKGDVLLSGFTTEQAPYVERAYAAQGCTKVQEHAIDEWVTLWLRNA